MEIIRYRASKLVTDLNGDFVSNVDYSSLEEDRDSWRRTCERLEREKIELRAKLAAAEKTIHTLAEQMISDAEYTAKLLDHRFDASNMKAGQMAIKAIGELKKGK